MKLVSKTLLEVSVGDRTYAMECRSDSPLGEVHDALSQMKAYIVARINEQNDNEQKAKEEPCQETSV